MKLPKQILDDLKCFKCEGFLSVSPVMIDEIGRNVCGRCFHLFPLKERADFVRELSFEKVAVLFRFNCKYHTEGCTFEYPFNRGLEHEKFCPYRYRYASLKHTNIQKKIEKNRTSFSEEIIPLLGKKDEVPYAKCISEDCNKDRVSSEVSLSSNHRSKSSASSSEVEENGGENLGMKNGSEDNISGAVAAKKSMESIYGNISLNSNSSRSRENVYESICMKNSTESVCCVHCQRTTDEETFRCMYGHLICKNCIGLKSVQCDTNRVSATPFYYCKNMPRGCTTKLKINDISGHEVDCEFGEFPCPVSGCSFKNVYASLIKHLVDSHKENVFTVEVVKRKALLKDEMWTQIVHNSVFVCKYFWYEEHDEFVAEYVGCQKNASKYKFQVEVEGKMNKTIVKKHDCQGWNAKYLDEAIIITDSELKKIGIDVLNFNYTFTIMPA